jgi:hypothetical protein
MTNLEVCDRCCGTGWSGHPDDPAGRCSQCDGRGGTADPVAHLEAAMAMMRKINRKVDDLLAPLEREMTIMQWPAEYRSIMWQAVLLGAKQRMEDVASEAAP